MLWSYATSHLTKLITKPSEAPQLPQIHGGGVDVFTAAPQLGQFMSAFPSLLTKT
jgi:hypothetical protein